MEVLVLDGKKYLKASRAARNAGYTSDYVGQLCRSGKIKAHLVGRSWYVDADQLSKHRVDKKRSSRVKAREQAKKAIKLSVRENTERSIRTSEKRFLEHSVTYESDEGILMPTVRKLPVETEKIIRKTIVRAKLTKDDGKNYTLENAGEKIRMTGELTVVDVSEDALGLADDDVTVLHPILLKAMPVKKPTKIAKTKKNNVQTTVTSVKNSKKTNHPKISSFEERLIKELGTTDSTEADRVPEIPVEGGLEIALETEDIEETHVSIFPYMSLAIVSGIFIVGFASFLEVQWLYTAGGGPQEITTLESTYSLTTPGIFYKLPF